MSTSREEKALLEWLELCRRIKQSTDIIHKESELEKKKRIEKLLTPGNEVSFFKYYFPHYIKSEFAWFHKKAFEDILVKEKPLNVLEWPRETAKSVIVDIFIPTHELVSGKLSGLILASETETKANKLIGDLEAELRSNKRLIHDFGDFGIIGSWAQGFYQTNNGIGFWSFGIGQNPSGVRNGALRPNRGTVDDADSKKKYHKNQERLQADIDWIRGEFAGCLATNGNILTIANNRVCKNGITANMVGDITEDDPKDPTVNHIKAYWTENPRTHKMLLPEQGGVPCWSYYTIEKAVQRINMMGWRNAMRQLYHKHVEEGKVFKDEDMPWVKIQNLHRYDAIVTYADPAFGESGKGCFRCVALLGKIGNDYDVIKVWLRQSGDFAAAQYNLHEWVKTKSPIARIADWVECNSLQRVLVKRAYKDLNLSLDIAWYPKYDEDKKADKFDRIESLETVFKNNHVRFNEDERKNLDMQELRDQFKGFPDGFIDGPDTIEGGISKLNKMSRMGDSNIRKGNYSRNYSRRG